MDIEDDIRKGIEQARLRRQREQQQAAEQERQARERAGHVDKVWPYLERYQEAMRLKYSPSILECVKPKILRNGDKVVIRDAWRISTHYGDADQIGQRARYRLWLDAMSPDLWQLKPTNCPRAASTSGRPTRTSRQTRTGCWRKPRNDFRGTSAS